MTTTSLNDLGGHTLARRAAEAWGGVRAAPRHVHTRENTVFEVDLVRGGRAALRLHRPGYHSETAIRSEMLWCESLADTGFPCPWPFRTASDDLLWHDPQTGVLVTVLQWLDAAPSRPPEAATPALYERIGALLADLHLTSDATAPRDLIRPVWLTAAFCDPDAPMWGRFRDNPALTADEAALLTRAAAEAAPRLDAIPAEQRGLIHADVLMDNVLDVDGTLFLIDFDDGGVGFRLYDLATALIEHSGTARFKPLSEALIAGYRADEGPLPESAFADLGFFLMLRALASAGWIAGRAPASDPRQRAYAARAVRLARAALNA